MSVIKDVKLVWKGNESASVVAVIRKRVAKVVIKRKTPSILKVVKVIRAGKKNATVLTNTGIKVKVPLVFSLINTELDKKKIGHLLKDGSHYFLSRRSYQYKHRCVDRSTAFYNKIKDAFNEKLKLSWLKRKYLCRDLGLDQDEAYLDFTGYAWESGIPYRMSLKPKKVWQAYVSVCLKGFLLSQYNKKVKIRKKEVSFDYLASINVI